MSFRINILICTIDEGIHKIHQLLEPFQEDVEYKISHQFRDVKYLAIPDNLKRKDVSISQISGKGLSRNRNNSLKMANGDIAVIADDDVKYYPESFKNITKVFENDPELDVACFKIKTHAGEPEFKDYPNYECVLKKHRHHYISSIEIAFRVESIKAKQIRFDERFGLGSEKYNAGEEEIFICDCINAGLKVMYFPSYIVEHPFYSSAKDTPLFEKRRNMLRGALNARIHGWKAMPKAFFDAAISFFKLIQNKRNPLFYLIERLTAIFDVYTSNRDYQM